MVEASILFLQKYWYWRIGHDFYLRLVFILTKFHNENRRHLEFWLDGIFGHVIQFKMLFCTDTRNLSQIPQSWAKLWLFCFVFEIGPEQ